MNMQRLFERIADTHEFIVRAEEVRPDYLRLKIGVDQQSEVRIEIFPYEATGPTGESVPLVLVGYPDDGEPVLVTPLPSAILAVALR
jgi:hypothetical protein